MCEPGHSPLTGAEIALDSLAQAFHRSTSIARLLLGVGRCFLALWRARSDGALNGVLLKVARHRVLDRRLRTGMHRRLPRALRRQPWRLFSWPTAGVPPHPLDEAVGFDSPVGRPSGAPSPTLRKVRFPLEQPRTRPLPMHRPRADSACPFHCSRLLSRRDLRVRRPSWAQPMRACAGALGNVRHMSCGGRVAR